MPLPREPANGPGSLSINRNATLRRAKSMASVNPAAPAPAIKTSVLNCGFIQNSCGAAVMCIIHIMLDTLSMGNGAYYNDEQRDSPTAPCPHRLAGDDEQATARHGAHRGSRHLPGPRAVSPAGRHRAKGTDRRGRTGGSRGAGLHDRQPAGGKAGKL